MSVSLHQSRIGWATLAGLVAVLLGLLLLLKQGDCNRSDDDGGDDGMEPAETCKPGDNSCSRVSRRAQARGRRRALPRRWWDRFLGGAAGNVLMVLLIGLYYDARKEEPGLVVWLAIVMCLPTWLVLAIIRRSELARWLETQRESIEVIDAVRGQVAERRGSLTSVVNTLHPTAVVVRAV